MKLPRFKTVYTVDIYFKGGSVLRKNFLMFKWKTSRNEFTELEWRTLPGDTFFAALDQIIAIDQVKSQQRIVFE